MSISTPNSLSNGRYRLGNLIGRGGMAEVREAFDTRLGRTVAIKIMRPDLATDDIFLSRFRREAHSAAQMNHPNIVNIHDSGEESVSDGQGRTELLPYIVMEYVKGQTLRDIIKVTGPLSQQDAQQVILGTLSALEYSHRMGIIHRDIKPGNIMISDQGIVKVMDFGIARALDESSSTMTQTQGVVGTAQYLSPEQARGETIDMRSDLYSAGCVLYEMLTGKPPFSGDSAVAIAYQHVSEVATPPSAIVPGLPRIWDNICAKSMAKDRNNRYPTAAAFKSDIVALMNGGEPVAAAFNPLTDLASGKSQRTVEQQATVAMPAVQQAPTSTIFAPSPAPSFAAGSANARAHTAVEAQTRSQQREELNQSRRKKTIILWALTALIVIALAVTGVVYTILNQQSDKQIVNVPTFSASTTKDTARERLKALGLELDERVDDSSELPEGTFVRQDPSGGSQVKVGSTVSVWFSAGPRMITVPDVRGNNQSTARKILENAGFTVDTDLKTDESPTIEKDAVVRTEPAANTRLKRGSSITLFISTGRLTVPQITAGQSLEEVTKILNDLQLSTNTQTEPSDSVPVGSVTRIQPAPGDSIEQHSAITIFVSGGPTQVTIPQEIKFGVTTWEKASKLLTQAGFKVSPLPAKPQNTDVVVALSDSSGKVLLPGKPASHGSTITVTTTPVEANKPKHPGPQPITPVTPPAT